MSFLRPLTALAGIALAAVGVALPAQAAYTRSSPPTPHVIDGGTAQSPPPGIARLTQRNELCTASIIAPQWVLTAQHCVEGAGDAINFSIGELSGSGGQKAKAKPGGVYVANTADLALVKLDHPVRTSYAPLGNRSAVPAPGRTVRTYGWGATCTDRPEGECQSPQLKVADVTLTNVACPDLRRGWALCASRGDGLPAGGDSGGPMFASGSDGKTYQVGVASTSDRAQNTTYTNITVYRDWIASIAGV